MGDRAYMEYVNEMSSGLIEAMRSDLDRELSDHEPSSEENSDKVNSKLNNYEYLLIG